MGTASAPKRALVTGANGIVGFNLLEEFKAREDWDVLALGRRNKTPIDGIAYRQADLADAAATRAALADGDFTHLFFAAYQPAKESDRRVPGPLYYYALEDLLFAEGRRDGFVTTILRPDYIAGVGFGSYTNLVSVIAVYATVCKATGLPLHFPGGPRSYETLFQMTDARLLARGMIWAAARER